MVLKIVSILGVAAGGYIMVSVILNVWPFDPIAAAIVGGAIWMSAFVAGCTDEIVRALKTKK